MAEYIIVKVVNEMGKQERMPNRIQFHNIHHESTLSDLYGDAVGQDDDNSCASDDNWKGKIGELVMAYNVTSSNKIVDARAFFALYNGPNDSGTGH